MDDKYRDHIKKNIEELKHMTKYKELLVACRANGLLSDVMCNIIDSLPDASDDKKHEELFLKLTRRGPDAYDTLIRILIDLRFSQAATLLDSQRHAEVEYKSINNPANIRLSVEEDPRTTSIENKLYISEGSGCTKFSDSENEDDEFLVPFTNKKCLENPFEVKKSKFVHCDPKVPCYPMKSRKRGVFLMVNIVNFRNDRKKQRSGSYQDEMSLLYLFQELGFICFAYRDLTSEKFFKILEKLRSSEYLEETECFLMALMSHGEMSKKDLHDRVEFYDGSVRKAKDIEDFFSNENCKSLLNKPKIFLFPFCRGCVPDKGVQMDSISSGPTINTPTRSDMIVVYACDRGFQALRDAENGSWYVQAFCNVMAADAHDTHLENMLKIIGGKVNNLRSAAGYMQTPSYANHGFNKALYFNPGVHE